MKRNYINILAIILLLLLIAGVSALPVPIGTDNSFSVETRHSAVK